MTYLYIGAHGGRAVVQSDSMSAGSSSENDSHYAWGKARLAMPSVGIQSAIEFNHHSGGMRSRDGTLEARQCFDAADTRFSHRYLHRVRNALRSTGK